VSGVVVALELMRIWGWGLIAIWVFIVREFGGQVDLLDFYEMK